MKSANEVMQVMSDQIDGLLNKTVTVKEASAVSNMVAKMISMQKLDLAFAKMSKQKPQLAWFNVAEGNSLETHDHH